MARILVAVLLTLVASAAWAERKALVIGNDTYLTVTPVTNARNDATSVADVLEQGGYQVSRNLDADRSAFVAALGAFAQGLGPEDDALVFFAGHGVQVDGRNFLLPVDVPALKPGAETTLEYASVEVGPMLDLLKRTGARSVTLILDACRNNPFPVGATRSVGVNRGLAILAPPRGVFVLYSADEGEEALSSLGDDDPSPNSVFTRVLLRHLQTPGLTVEDLANAVQGEVNDLASGVNHSQFPAYYDRLAGELILVPASASPPEVAEGDDAAQALAACGALASPGAVAFPALRDGDPGAAVAACRLAFTLNPGQAEASFWLARSLDALGEGSEAFGLYRIAAEAGSAGAMNNLGSMYQNAVGTAGDDAQAVRWYRAAAEAGHVGGMYNLGWMLANGRGVEADQAEAARWYASAAEGGDPDAMYALGIMSRDGMGVPQDDARAFEWYRAAAGAGNADGAYALGWAYENGTGTAQDDAEAARWYRVAAEAGHAGGMYALGLLHDAGRGVVQSEAEALRWYLAAAEGGNVAALTTIGLAHQYGRGTPVDPAEALRWYQAAADAGDGPGMRALAQMYEAGAGVPQDLEKAAQWHRAADRAMGF